ncbi:Ger(x)C family spore germination protein [Heliophilum fasciatum]|uniref:Ger(X)C family germination protein n=1 Tax=Heliophilum fasciatum TaxID=35700 RepID=A0A4R2RG09_9FIRM|nr:Ger(x)C family spore germination protein [Heliophilum fasciatum]MCW2279071.1 Ger(x)C family germination protein [Heliophilum fasciatum]TCP61468.1 Ger(x)C family germination protein [Heliophilum fasciatum]
MRQTTYARLILLLLLLISIIIASGCSDKSELEQRAFIITLGIDRGPKNEYIVTALIAVPSAMASTRKDSTGGPPQVGKVLTAVGESLPEALSMINSQAERRTSYVQCRSLVISEAIARDGLHSVIDTFNRYREFRKTLFITLFKGAMARETLLLTTPVLEASLSRLVENLSLIQQDLNFSPSATLLQLSNAIETPHTDSVIPVLSLNPQVAEEKKGPKVVPKPTADLLRSIETSPNIVNTKPGEMNRSGGNPLDLIGAGVLVQGKLVTYLSGDEMRIYSILRDTYNTGIWSFPDSRVPGSYVSVILNRSRPVRVEVDANRQPMQIRIKGELDGVLMEVPVQSATVDEAGFLETEAMISQALSQQTHQLIERMQRIPADPFNFVRSLQWRSWTSSAFNSLPWREMFQAAEVEVDIHAHLRRFGTQGQSQRPAGG